MISSNNYDASHFNFLLSNWYSGATVLSILLNNHRQITCNGETFPFLDQTADELQCSCGESLTDCEFYKYSAEHFRLGNTYNPAYFGRLPIISAHDILQRTFESFRLHKIRDILCNLNPRYQHIVHTFIKQHKEFFERACKFDNSTIYLDGTKSIRRAELFANYGDKPIRILHCIRDGRKFIPTYLKVSKLSVKDIQLAIRRWVDYIEMVNELKNRYPNIQIKTIRHEDLCSDTESTVKDICDFLEVSWDENIFDFTNSKYHILGNQMRHKFDGTISESDKWKSFYTDEIFDKTTESLKPYLKQYGYL